MILRIYLTQLNDVDSVEFRTKMLMHCKELPYIVKGKWHQVRSVCSYWLLANAADRSAEDCDGHAQSFASVSIGSLGKDLENIIIQLALNDELGTWYLS